MKDIYLTNYSVKGIKTLDKTVSLSFYKKTINKETDTQEYNIKGIYGMNGSGKSGIVTSVEILRNLIIDTGYLNNPITQNHLDAIVNKKVGKLSLEAEFMAKSGGELLLYQYEITLSKNKTGKFTIAQECLKGKKATLKSSSLEKIYEVCDGEIIFIYGSEGTLFVITSIKSLVPEMKELLIDIIISVLLILLLTAGMLTIWNYRSIITPIKKLEMATQNIKEGNLDFTLEIDSNDEIGELCQNFEEMRQRLKDSAEEKLASEKENRVLISNIAHDLKTPITAVKGYSEGLMDGVADTPEKRDKYIKTIYNKANEMDLLLNELTLYSKIDTNRIPYNFSKINVMEYFDDCVEEIGLDLEAKNIGLSYFNYAGDDVQIIADPEQLKRVIHNIINNSIKYLDKPKGFINIRVKDVGDFIQVEIEDNGKGIAKKDLPYIFDRFFRADTSRNSATGGSGIGLSIVRKINEDHGGKIWATSKEETGTIMYFVLRKYQEVPNE